MNTTREVDIREKSHKQGQFKSGGKEDITPASATAAKVSAFIDRALEFSKSQAAPSGFGDTKFSMEFTPDSMVQTTSSGAVVVNLAQTYRGLPIFEMSKTVLFNPAGDIEKTNGASGDTIAFSQAIDLNPKLSAATAVLKAAKHLAETGSEEERTNAFGQKMQLPSIELGGFTPKILAGFPSLAARATVLEKGPFENPIPAHLLIFAEARPRLAWHIIFTFPKSIDQYVVIIAADNEKGEVLFCKSLMHHIFARGRVYEFSPGIEERRMMNFPRPLGDYPDVAHVLPDKFPTDWVDGNQTIGNSTNAILVTDSGEKTFIGQRVDGLIEFDPKDKTGDEQKLLNIFYFCNFMHDFLLTLGFDEATGNFQKINFTNQGLGEDAVLAYAHSGPVYGTANMLTDIDGRPPIMNMGLYEESGRHTALDADVVFHEYVHGLTNRIVGGRVNPHALNKLQSGGMGEGWGDFYALSIQNYFRNQEKTAIGDWLVDNARGMRRAPYDDNFPYKYGDKNFAKNAEVHMIGEIWCATLMMMTRKIRMSLKNDQEGYKLAWHLVTDGLKLTRANPTFLDAREAILKALEYLADAKSAHPLTPKVYKLVKTAVWQAFAHFGMGIKARSKDVDDLKSVIFDNTLPEDISMDS